MALWVLALDTDESSVQAEFYKVSFVVVITAQQLQKRTLLS